MVPLVILTVLLAACIGLAYENYMYVHGGDKEHISGGAPDGAVVLHSSNGAAPKTVTAPVNSTTTHAAADVAYYAIGAGVELTQLGDDGAPHLVAALEQELKDAEAAVTALVADGSEFDMPAEQVSEVNGKRAVVSASAGLSSKRKKASLALALV